MDKMRTLVHKRGLLHIETPLGIVNIRVGLEDSKGRRVESIETLAPEYVGEPKIVLRGYVNTRLVELKTKRR